MPTLTISFPGKRYHATPWGSHVNEGQVEWPPSPWRICRALLATGMSKLGWREDDLPPAATELLTALASVLPAYRVPAQVTVAHSRHYMPIAGNTTKVFDGFARVGDGEVQIGWDVELSAEAFMLFAQLAEQLSYLGRAESWASGSVAPGRLQGANCTPCLSPELAPGFEPITVLAPMTSADFITWRQGQVEARPELAAAGKGRRGRAKASAPVIPEALVECMLRSTDELQRQGWSSPPGSRRVLYARPLDALASSQPEAPSRPRLRAVREPVACALIALSSYAVNGEVLPQLRLALPQMEALHRALTRRLDRRTCPEITGRDEDRAPLQDGHQHAHYVPLCVGDRRRDAIRRSDAAIDHILIVAPRGLEHLAQEAIEGLRWISSALVSDHAGDDDDERDRDRRRLTTTLVAMGDLAMIRGALRERVEHDLFGESAVWESHTPFIAPRYVKERQPIEALIQAELASRGLPAAAHVEVCAREAVADAGFLTYVRRRRRGKPQPPSTQPWRLRLTFDAPIKDRLIALGYGSHFGLGLFRPAMDPR